jgi:hypothetical protein
LGKIVRKFIAENADERVVLVNAKSMLEAKKNDLELQLKPLRTEIQKLEDRLIKLDIEIVGFDERIKVLVSRELNKSGIVSQEIKAKELLLREKRRNANRVKTPSDWEKESKLPLVMQHAATGKLSTADEARIVQKMKIKPGEVTGWLYRLKPERISLERLEKARCHTFPSPPNLQALKAQGNIREPFYALLMMWLNLPTPEAVDLWIIQGSKKPDTSEISSVAGGI